MTDRALDETESIGQVTAGDRVPPRSGESVAGASPPAGLQPGDSVGRYTVRKLLGKGGMGQVVAAFDPEVGRTVALKIVNPSVLASSSRARARFVREAQALGRLSHTNVVTIFDVGPHRDQIYVAMELIEGVTLAGWLADGERSWREIRDVFLAAGRGLEAAHAAGLVHRDFKPQNVMVARGRVVVLDFGLARAGDADDDAEGDPAVARDASLLAMNLTLTGERLGTPNYMSPEQHASLPATAKSDQFAFCVALFGALYGRLPFVADTLAGLAAATRGPIVWPTSPPVPRFLVAVLARGLRVDPAERYPSMTALLADLARDPGRMARRGLVAGGAIVALVGAGALLAWRGGLAAMPSCASASQALDTIWQPARRQALATAFAAMPGRLGSDAWALVEPALDDWAGRWRALRIEVCETDRAGTRASPIATAQRDCLERRRGELEGLLAALAVPDTTIAQYAASAAHALTPPETCLGAAPGGADAAPPPASHETLGKARARIDAARALRLLGKYPAGLAEATGAAADAEKIGWPPLTAEAELELGAAQIAAGATNAAGQAYYQAMWGAEAARDDVLRFDAMLGLQQVSVESSEYLQAGRWIQTATVVERHLPGDARRRLSLGLAAARLASFRAQFRTCVTLGDDAIAEAERIAGPESPEVVSALLVTAGCQIDLDESLSAAMFKRALTISEKVNGHEHPQTAHLLSDVGVRERSAGNLDASLHDLEESLAIRERVQGPETPDSAATHNNLANTLRELGRFEEAMRHVDRAIVIWTKVWNLESPAIAVGLATRGAIEMAEGRPAAAEASFRRSLEIRRKKRPAGHPDIARALQKLASALAAQGKAEAIPLLEEALAALEHDPDTTAERRAEARYLLGQARVDLGVDRAGGLAIATEACKELATAECRAWLDAR